MKNQVLTAAIVIAFIIVAIPIATDNESDGATTTYYITGYVVETLQSDNSPLEGVTVSILYNTTATATDITDDMGFFSIATTSNSGLQIKFELAGYSVRGLPDCFEKQEGSSYYLLDLSGITPENNVYQVTSYYTGIHCAIMGSTTGYISGTVSYSGGAVNGATVTLVSAGSNSKYTVTTDKSGAFYLSSCPTGTYYMSVSCNGFKNSETRTVVVSDSTEPQTITLVQSNNATFFGMDSAHFLMTLGVIFGVVITIVMLLVSRRQDINLTIVDDTEEDDEDDIKS